MEELKLFLNAKPLVKAHGGNVITIVTAENRMYRVFNNYATLVPFDGIIMEITNDRYDLYIRTETGELHTVKDYTGYARERSYYESKLLRKGPVQSIDGALFVQEGKLYSKDGLRIQASFTPRIKMVASNEYCIAVITLDGKLYVSQKEEKFTEVALGGESCSFVCCGLNQCAATTTGGKLYSFGYKPESFYYSSPPVSMKSVHVYYASAVKLVSCGKDELVIADSNKLVIFQNKGGISNKPTVEVFKQELVTLSCCYDNLIVVVTADQLLFGCHNTPTWRIPPYNLKY